MTSATIPIDVIVRVMKNRRKTCIARTIACGSDPLQALALKYITGRISPGVARNARLQMTTCACGKPGGIRSLSKNLAKNARARSERSSQSFITATRSLAMPSMSVSITSCRNTCSSDGELHQLPQARDRIVRDDTAVVEDDHVGRDTFDALEHM